MMLTMQDLEAAINHWRARAPARGNEFALSPEVTALARVYALMIFRHAHTLSTDTLDAATRRLLEPTE
ncbi:MAG: DUF3717 domain-containing protein [Pseudomonadota bacterium]